MSSKNKTRRDVMRATGASLLLSALAGCSQVASLGPTDESTERRTIPDGLNFAAGWEFQSENSVLERSSLSPEDTTEMVSASILASPKDAERVKWEYLKEISSDFAGHFTDTAFKKDEFLVVVEALLPKSHTINDKDVFYDDDTLEFHYEIVPSDEPGKTVIFSNSFEKWRATNASVPSEVTVELRYRSSEN